MREGTNKNYNHDLCAIWDDAFGVQADNGENCSKYQEHYLADVKPEAESLYVNYRWESHLCGSFGVQVERSCDPIPHSTAKSSRIV